MSTQKTLDYLALQQKKEETENNNNTSKKKKKQTTSNEKAAPTIPLSPQTKPDDNLQIELQLKKLELRDEKWETSILSQFKFHNLSTSINQIAFFGLNNPKFEYASCIKHIGLNKTKITEFMDDSKSIQIVQQFNDIGCPMANNPKIKKGCWCLNEIKKQKINKFKNIKSKLLNSNNIPITIPITASAASAAAANHSLYLNHVLNPNYAHLGLLNSSKIPQLFNSTKMQQFRTLHLLNQKNLNNKSIINNLNNLNNNKTSQSVLGVRKHKDTITFNDTKDNNQPPVKKRKKSRWK